MELGAPEGTQVQCVEFLQGVRAEQQADEVSLIAWTGTGWELAAELSGVRGCGWQSSYAPRASMWRVQFPSGVAVWKVRELDFYEAPWPQDENVVRYDDVIASDESDAGGFLSLIHI